MRYGLSNYTFFTNSYSLIMKHHALYALQILTHLILTISPWWWVMLLFQDTEAENVSDLPQISYKSWHHFHPLKDSNTGSLAREAMLLILNCATPYAYRIWKVPRSEHEQEAKKRFGDQSICFCHVFQN